MTTPDRTAVFQDVDPPLWVAWNQALASIRVRFLRQSLTTLGIALGIAFLSFVLVSQSAAGRQLADADRYRWLAGTSLLMCLVGVTNSMLISVAERYREIGTIKCLGASDGFIVKVFVLESLLLGSVGSAVGALVGVGLGAVVSSLQGAAVPSIALVQVLVLGSLAGIALTVLAAIAPAIQAARMPAAAALRVEV